MHLENVTIPQIEEKEQPHTIEDETHDHHPQPSPTNTSATTTRHLPPYAHADYVIQQGRAKHFYEPRMRATAKNICSHECALLQTYAAD